MTSTDKPLQPVEIGSETSNVRATRIARLRREIAVGTYVVDAEATAAALIERGTLIPPAGQ